MSRRKLLLRRGRVNRPDVGIPNYPHGHSAEGKYTHLCEEGYVFTPFLSVCLFVCRISQKLCTDPGEILWTGSVCDKDELIRF